MMKSTKETANSFTMSLFSIIYITGNRIMWRRGERRCYGIRGGVQRPPDHTMDKNNAPPGGTQNRNMGCSVSKIDGLGCSTSTQKGDRGCCWGRVITPQTKSDLIPPLAGWQINSFLHITKLGFFHPHLFGSLHMTTAAFVGDGFKDLGIAASKRTQTTGH